MMRPVVLLFVLGLAACSTHAADRDPRLTLKQWGLAYCIAEHVEGGAGHGGAAMGGYFQLGSHESEDAYANVRRFFDDWVEKRPAVPKTPGTDLSLMTCINAYESAEYASVVREQDRFLPPSVE
ncbi:hypothetical protein N799_12270 [Lysobacter arseniciresistens ZS79]|uniref:Uncharacterized protein n=1 Tax=Lysobacter arseniciresistens ZS79 TaxID=913325 RepID=A0A0A0F1D9_9GAMM|nr:hypothetical protein [Lysobacter arseniciresistens]KGM56976.1 hypothetical protein N799_12270 [Lysobacter arseniciresistens ZS79]